MEEPLQEILEIANRLNLITLSSLTIENVIEVLKNPLNIINYISQPVSEKNLDDIKQLIYHVEIITMQYETIVNAFIDPIIFEDDNNTDVSEENSDKSEDDDTWSSISSNSSIDEDQKNYYIEQIKQLSPLENINNDEPINSLKRKYEELDAEEEKKENIDEIINSKLKYCEYIYYNLCDHNYMDKNILNFNNDEVENIFSEIHDEESINKLVKLIDNMWRKLYNAAVDSNNGIDVHNLITIYECANMLREQLTTNLLINKNIFKKICIDQLHEISDDKKIDDEAIEILHTAAEDYLIEIFKKAKNIKVNKYISLFETSLDSLQFNKL